MQEGGGSTAAVDLSALSLEGPFDFTSEIQLAQGGDTKPTSRYRFFLRDNALRVLKLPG